MPPGLYSVGSPGPGSPVIVTANYTLSFDAVRSSLGDLDTYILVLDTKGINVWCAAGKGTFGTDELVNRIHKTGLSSVVNHHRLILPQLGAPGVAAHEVHKATGFHVEYGPVRASDLPEFLKERVATPEMRKVKFDLRDRIVLIPVELRSAALYAIIAAIALWFAGGWLPAMGFLAAVLAGTVVFPGPAPLSSYCRLQHKRAGPRNYRCNPFCRTGLPYQPGNTPVGWCYRSNFDTLYTTSNNGLSCPEFYRLYPLHFQDRGKTGNLPIYTIHGRVCSHRGCLCNVAWINKIPRDVVT